MTTAEIRSSEIIEQQTDKQLEYTLNELQDLDSEIEFIVVPAERVGWIVKTKFMIDAILHEMEYREEGKK